MFSLDMVDLSMFEGVHYFDKIVNKCLEFYIFFLLILYI